MAAKNSVFVLALVASACTRWYGYAPSQGGASEKEPAKPAPADKADKGEAKAAPAPAFTVPHLECEGGDETKCRQVGQAHLRQKTVVRDAGDRRTYFQHQVGNDRSGCEKVGDAVRCGEAWEGWVSVMDQRELAQRRSRPAPAKKPAAKKECEEPATPAPAAKAEDRPAAPAVPAPAAPVAPAPPPAGGGNAAVIEAE